MKNEETNIEKKIFSNENPFTTPNGYFDSFAEKIMLRIEEEEKVSTSKKVMRYLKPTLAFAASFLIIFMLIYYPIKKIGTQMADTSLHEFELLDYYHLNEQILLTTFEFENNETYNDETLETVLLASVSEMELMDFKN